MQIQLVGMIQEATDSAPLPTVMGTFTTPKGISVVFFPEMSIEVFTAIRDHLNADIARLVSERAMLNAMQPQGPVQ